MATTRGRVTSTHSNSVRFEVHSNYGQTDKFHMFAEAMGSIETAQRGEP